MKASLIFFVAVALAGGLGGFVVYTMLDSHLLGLSTSMLLVWMLFKNGGYNE